MVRCYRLYELYPTLAHVEKDTLVYPSWKEPWKQFDERHAYNWSKQYSSHVWKTLNPEKIPKSPNEIIALNSTLGQMMRYVYNGPR